jgi:putative exosortase-associated protein (TIGR04073 family)
MKQSFILGAFIIASFFLIQNAVFAETVEGKVEAVNPMRQSIHLSYNKLGFGEKDVDLQLQKNSSLSGIKSLDELEVGDTVKAEFEQTESGEKKITSLKLQRSHTEQRAPVAVSEETHKNSAPAATSASIQTTNRYTWGDKLSRGFLNFFTSPVEIPRTIDRVKIVNGPGEGWTVGLVKGIGRTFLRAGAGILDVVTCPFGFPNEDKSPMIQPEFAWQNWPVG